MTRASTPKRSRIWLKSACTQTTKRRRDQISQKAMSTAMVSEEGAGARVHVGEGWSVGRLGVAGLYHAWVGLSGWEGSA